jgi:hypothetical protein
MGTGSCHGWRKAVPGDPMESRLDLRVPSEGSDVGRDGPASGSPPVRQNRSRCRVPPSGEVFLYDHGVLDIAIGKRVLNHFSLFSSMILLSVLAVPMNSVVDSKCLIMCCEK